MFVTGSSVAVEGVDCELMDRKLHGVAESFNLGSTGLSPREMLLLSDAIEHARPDLVLLGLDPSNFIAPEINFEKLIGYRAAGLKAAENPDEQSRRLNQFFSARERGILTAGPVRGLLQARSLPLIYLENKFRERAGSQLRMQGYATNFKAPWIRLTSLTGANREHDLAAESALLQGLNVESGNKQWQAVQLLVSSYQAKGMRVAGIIWPINPRLRGHYPTAYLDALNRALRDLFQTHAYSLIDLGPLLTEEEYSDALHPNAVGRAKVSAALAELIPGELAAR